MLAEQANLFELPQSEFCLPSEAASKLMRVSLYLLPQLRVNWRKEPIKRRDENSRFHIAVVKSTDYT